MDERCHNNIQLVSSEAGILYVLERFHEVMGLPLPAEGDHPLFDESRANMLAHSVNLALEKRPSALDALFAIDGTRLLEACLCIAYPYRNDVWILKMYLRTEGLAVEHAFDELLLDNAGYLFSNVWNLEKKIDQNEIAFLCCNGEMRPFAYSAEDEDFGADRQAAAYVREVLGLEPSLSEWRVRDLVRADDVAELMRHADEKAVREYATHADFCKLFKDGKFELYAFLLGITSWRRLRYAPRDIEKYLVTFCEAEAGAAMDAFLDRYAWNDEDLDRAEDIVSKFSSSCPGNAVASSALVRIRSIIEGRSKERAAERSAATSEAVSLDAGGILRIDGDLFRRNGGIPSEFYRGNPSIKSVVCECGILGEGAFAGCENLASFEINCHSGLVKIGDGCFVGCLKLTSFKTTGYKISMIGSKVFDGCESITSLSLQLDKATLKANALGSIPHLEKISIAGEGRVSKNAFAGCPSLKRIRIGKYVKLNKGALSELGEDVVVFQ